MVRGASSRRASPYAAEQGAERLMLGGLSFLADLAWEAGDLDMASRAFAKRSRSTQYRDTEGQLEVVPHQSGGHTR